jgi:hypothetical protein
VQRRHSVVVAVAVACSDMKVPVSKAPLSDAYHGKRVVQQSSSSELLRSSVAAALAAGGCGVDKCVAEVGGETVSVDAALRHVGAQQAFAEALREKVCRVCVGVCGGRELCLSWGSWLWVWVSWRVPRMSRVSRVLRDVCVRECD